jgi:EAL domain-containing protein (putative c-di-GMP-specific phosphodiesterase class I)
MRTETQQNSIIWSLEGILNNGKTWFIPINSFPFRIGRHKSCQLTLSPKSISRYHAEIYQIDGTLWIHDLNSMNGTFVNKQKVASKAFLRDCDIIHIADLKFRVSLKSSADFHYKKETQKTIDIERNLESNFVNCEQEFIEKLSKEAVVPYYQPIVKLSNARTIGYEILGRCYYKRLPTGPIELFKIASLLGYENNLSELFRKEGVRLGKVLPKKSIFFVNTHPQEIFQKSLLKSLSEIRKAYPSRPMVLEIHEKAITDLKLLKRLRKILTDLKIGLAYDDFGAGQARLIELIEIPPDFLKFDISIIHNIHKAPLRKQQIVERLVSIVHDFGIIQLAEGIECKEESDVCSQIGFNYGQGFYFGRPGPINSQKDLYNKN